MIDALTQPSVSSDDELRRFLPEPWRSRGLPPAMGRTLLQASFSEYVDDVTGPGLPGSDPDKVFQTLVVDGGADTVVLTPPTRGLIPEVRHEVAIASATNEWLAETWLSRYPHHGRFRGSIRVSTRSAREAVREIERWAGNPDFAQIVVPLETHAPYGDEQYFPIWEAACQYGLPIAIKSDGAGIGVELPMTAVGYPTRFIEGVCLPQLNAAVHVASLICEGVFERLDKVRFVIADGGFDALGALLWRLDKDWRGSRSEVPWARTQPTHYLDSHVRFILSRWDGPANSEQLGAAIEIWNAQRLLIYGSNYPRWDYFAPDEARRFLPSAYRASILSENARALFSRIKPL